MNTIRILSLYSGSTGNAFLIQGPLGAILIDAGKSAKQLCQSLGEAGVSPDAIGAIFVTHEHSDHINALPVFLKKHPLPIHIPQGCVYKLITEASVAPHLHPHPPIYTEEVCGMRVTSFPTPHDSHASVGYRIEVLNAKQHPCFRIGYATDIGYVSKEVESGLSGCDAVILESNHDPEMLMNGMYPYALKQRIASRRGHLPNEECALLAARLCGTGTKALMLAHLSQENNTPSLAFDGCWSAIADVGVQLFVAHPNQITEMSFALPGDDL